MPNCQISDHSNLAMNSTRYVLLVALILIVPCYAAIPGLEDCSTRSSQGKFIDGEIFPCNTNPCTLVKGQNTSIKLKFQSKTVVKGGKIKVFGIIAGVPVPFTLPDSDICHFTKPGCVIQPDTLEEMDYSLTIKESYPSISLTIKWILVNDASMDIFCIKFPAKLASPKVVKPHPLQRPLIAEVENTAENRMLRTFADIWRAIQSYFRRDILA